MARTVGIGIQDFGTIQENNYFYIDKTGFIKEWWENGDSVTLITRPRRFGKTLTYEHGRTAFFLWIMQKEEIGSKTFLSGRRRSIGIFKGLIRLSAFLLQI